MKRILVIAGSDCSGGAGLQADIKAAVGLGAYPMTVVTAVTSQNTKGVQAVHHVPGAHIASQLASITDDITFDAVKVGMLGSDEAADVVSSFLAKLPVPVIVDPVLVAQSGGRLSAPEIVRSLFGIATLVTPNADEAAALTGISIDSATAVERAADALLRETSRVLVKGGDSDVGFDLYADRDGLRERFPIRRIATCNTHGTGCSLATSIATLCAQGRTVGDAVAEARDYVRLAIAGGVPLGSGFGTVHALTALEREAARYSVLQALADAVASLKGLGVGPLVPEIQTNLVYVMPFAESCLDVAGYPGRIIRIGDDIHAPFCPVFGGSRHVANIALAAGRYFPKIRSAMALRYIPALVERLESAGFVVASFNRDDEPKEVRDREGSSLDWGVSHVCAAASTPPDFIWDPGSVGKEPAIRVLGTEPADVVRKVLAARKLLDA